MIKKTLHLLRKRSKEETGFTLVELVIVIAVMTILSGASYLAVAAESSNARDARRMHDLKTYQDGLEIYFKEHGNYPDPIVYDATDEMWGYNSAVPAQQMNTYSFNKEGNTITTLASAAGGGYVKDTNDIKFIGKKGTIEADTLGGKMMSKSLHDPFLAEILLHFEDKRAFERGVGKYVYATYHGESDTALEMDTKPALKYQLATTLEKGYDTNRAYIVGNYDNTARSNLPASLIGPGDSQIVNGQEQIGNSGGVPYLVNYLD